MIFVTFVQMSFRRDGKLFILVRMYSLFRQDSCLFIWRMTSQSVTREFGLMSRIIVITRFRFVVQQVLLESRCDFIRDFIVMVNFLYVVVIFQYIDQTYQFRCGFCIYISFGRRDYGNFRVVCFQICRFQSVAYFIYFFLCSVDINRVVIIGYNVFSICFQCCFYDGVFIVFFEGDYVFFVEQIGNGIISIEVIVIFVKCMTYFSNGTVAVVRQIFNYDCRVVRIVIFVDDGFYVCIIIIVYITCNCAVQCVTGYVVRQCFIYRRTQTRVSVRIVIVQFSRGYQFTNDFSEDFIAFSILRSFTMFGVGLFIMICYKNIFRQFCLFRQR